MTQQLPDLTDHEYNMAHAIAEVVVARLLGSLKDIRDAIEEFIPRRSISARVRSQILDDVKQLGGFCPCCHRVRLIECPSKNYEWDHFYARNRVKHDEVWPICKACHRGKTHLDSQREFDAFQAMRAKLPGKQRVIRW